MPRSRARKGEGGSRWQTVGIFLTLLAVAALVGSAAAGLAPRFFGGAGPGDALPTATARPVPAGVRVEVLNASGIAGLARRGADYLRERGFDVVTFDNAPAAFGPDSSLVIDRVGRVERARLVADAMAIHRVVARPDTNLFVDATVVLGRDWIPSGEAQQ
jgi:hypothetical protein